MVQSWYMAPLTANDDQRLPHKTDPVEELSLDVLKEKTGCLYWKIDDEDIEHSPVVDKIREERGYNYKDVITISPEKLENYDAKIKIFFDEHLHSDEEIRLILEGSGYFDVRDTADRWVRVLVEKGDLLVLPAGSYHRFTCDSKDYIKAARFFCGEPVWKPYPRGDESDKMTPRVEYLKQMTSSA